MRGSSFPLSSCFSFLHSLFYFFKGLRFAVRAARYRMYFNLHAILYVRIWYLPIKAARDTELLRRQARVLLPGN